ncbi:hypothetical protein GCM10010259_18000 [Streptomyces daghestanicus]|uniref:Uncharacterized protein n=1 Tax=Streptomyces daghestanicus TaxID=66885 RepID=A0ABQ3Q3J5_9ACTN|nr:hypothetical protein GCM10010259_18000 [Streptomyces daghestanicus]GHI31863.1 hypothetical protein Sdagh_35930 [Streptomyces daghestanicus]
MFLGAFAYETVTSDLWHRTSGAGPVTPKPVAQDAAGDPGAGRAT